MDEKNNEVVSFQVHEGAMARMERSNLRMLMPDIEKTITATLKRTIQETTHAKIIIPEMG